MGLVSLGHAEPTITTDKLDYFPTETATITGAGFQSRADITVTITRPGGSVDSCILGETWRMSPCPLTSDDSGGFVAYYTLDGVLGTYTVTASDGTSYASTTFTDSLSTDWTQCENDHDHNGAIDTGGVCFWTTGNLDVQHNLFAEGNTLPDIGSSAGEPTGRYTTAANAPGHSNQRAIIQGVPDGTLRIRITYEFTKAGIKAYDFLTTNYGITDSNLCTQLPSGVTSSACSSIVGSSASKMAFPLDTTTSVGTKTGDIEDRQTVHTTTFTADYGSKSGLPANEVRQMKIYGLGSGSITSITNVGITSGSPTGNSDASVDIIFTKSTGGASIILAAFGAHFAISSLPPAGWGTGNGAGSIQGSPFHVTFDGLFNNSNNDQLAAGSRDNQVSVSTVLGVTVSCSPSKGTTGKPVSCTATANGGKAPYTFSWSAPGGSPSGGTSSSFSTTYAVPGTYSTTVTVTDSRGVSASSTVMFEINPQPKTLSVTCSTENTAGKPVTCNAASTGGYPPITFTWSALDGSPSSGTGSSFTTTFPTKGTYIIRVTQIDGDGLTVTQSVTVSVAGQPLTISAQCPDTTAGKPVTCSASASGGTQPYTFSSLTTTFPVKGSYSYTITVTDANGGTASTTVTILVRGQPLVVVVDCPDSGLTAGKPFTCTVSATGGTSPYSGTGTFTVTEPVKGTFTEAFTVTDANGASSVGSDTVVIAAQPLVVSVACADGTAGKPITCDVSASGGTSPYTGTGTFQMTFPTKGTFTVRFTVTDANGVSATGSDMVVIAPQPLIVSVVCGDGTSGKPITCDVSATGGTSPYNGTGAFQRTFPAKGTFTVSFTVTDANGVSATGSDTVVISPQPLIVIVACADGTAGKPINCDVSATGGTTPYTGTGTFSVTEPVKGTFTESFTVTDANGVSSAGSDTVAIAAQPLIVIVDCLNSGVTAGKPFTCTVSATGGTSPYSGTGSFSVTEPVKGTFRETFTVTDANGASASGSDVVNVAPQPLIITATCPKASAGKPVTCSASATGGTSPYDFSALTTSFPVKGTYPFTVTVTDANGASASATIDVVVNPQPLLVTASCPSTTSGKPVTCTASATGGTQPYSFSSLTTSFAAKGTYDFTITVIDANGASASVTVPVVVEPQPLQITMSCPKASAGKPVTCSASASGGTGPYSFSSLTTRFPVKGTYPFTVSVTDANGASASARVPVVVNPQPLLIDVSCPKASAGKPVTCTVSASGGTEPYAFSDLTTSFPVKGTYPFTVTVTDANGDRASMTVSILVNPQPLSITASCSKATTGKPVTCTASAAGGTQPYSFSSLTTSFPVKGEHPFTITVTDANGVSASTTVTVVVNPQPLVITASCSSATAGKPVSCNASASGGTQPYGFAWDVGKDGSIDGTGAYLLTSFAVKGSYSVDAIVKDANGATARVNTPVVVGPQPLVITASCENGTAGKPVRCSASASGGTTPYVFTWDVGKDGSIDGSGSSFETTFPVKGTYSIDAIVRDGNGAVARVNLPVSIAPQPLVITATCQSGATAGKPLTCSASASGGTTPYTFTWDNGKDGIIDGTGPTYTTSFAVKGTYSIDAIVRDGNGATAMVNIPVVIGPQPLRIVPSSCPATGTAGKPVTCTATAAGGTGPYLFSWDVGKDGTIDGQGETFTTSFAVKGTYSIDEIVVDANGATSTLNWPIAIAPQPLVITASCQPGTAGKPTACSASATGGTTPYAFLWDVGKDGTIDGTGADFATVFPVKGTYSIDAIVVDANNARAFVNLSIRVEPQPLVITASCQPGTAGKPTDCSASVSGGTTPYTFLWDIGKDGIIDGQGSGFTTVFAVKGSYSIDAVVVDANQATAFVNLPIIVRPQPLVITASCQPGTAGKPTNCDASASGGTTPYTFLWDIGKDGLIDGQGNSFTTVFPVKGSYSIDAIVTDANAATAFVNLPVIIRPQALVITATCQPGTAGKPTNCDASASGGTTPYTFLWDIGKDGTIEGQGATFTTVFPVKGLYSIDAIVVDANDARAIVNLPAEVRPQALVITASCFPGTAGKPTDCNATASGGTAPYRFLWDVGKDGTMDGSGSTFTTVFPVKGLYSVDAIVVDANSATAFVNLPVDVRPQPLVITASCLPGTAGKPTTCSASATGGTAPYTFTWDVGKDGTTDGTGSSFATSFPTKGAYSIDAMVKDANGATARVNLPISVQPQPLVITASCGTATAGKPVTCTASATGGTTPYGFRWDVGKDGTTDGTGASFTTTFATKGTYSIDASVTDSNGVTSRVNIPVTVAPQPLVADFNTNCVNDFITRFTGTVSGGTMPYQFSWTFGDGSGTFNGNPVDHHFNLPGTYTVAMTVRDANGASTTVTKQSIACGLLVTDTSFCFFDTNSTAAGQQFRLLFLQNTTTLGLFDLRASNPGQFYVNVFYVAPVGGTSSLTLTVDLPFPFVTQEAAARPVHVYSGISLSNGCFVPSGDITSMFNIQPSPYGVVTLADYGYTKPWTSNIGDVTPFLGTTTQVSVTLKGSIPSGGLAWLTIHVDYGLKKHLSLPATDAKAFRHSYTFSVSGDVTSSDTISNDARVVKDPAIAGIVTDAYGTPVANVMVKLFDQNGVLVGTTFTDRDGIYLFIINSRGSKTWTVQIFPSGGTPQTSSIKLQPNHIVWVNFAV